MTPDALESLIRNSARDVLRYFERRVAQPADAADCLSEVLLVLWRDRSRVPDDPLEARLWMFGIARTTLAAAGRRSGRRSAEVERLRVLLEATPTDLHADSEGLAIDVREAIAGLPEAQREVVQLHHWEGLPLVDIAAVVGTSPSTVRSRYAAARASLAQALAPYGVDV